MLRTFAEGPRERRGHPGTVLRCGLKFTVPWLTAGIHAPLHPHNCTQEVALHAMALTLEVALQLLGRNDC